MSSDEDNGLYRTFGGRNKAIAVIVAFLVALAFFIAGAVMLGVGIHKANTKPTCTIEKQNTAFTTTAGSVKKQTTPAPQQTITAKPFYLTLRNSQVTGKNVRDDFGGSVKAFSDIVAKQLSGLSGTPSITVLSVTPSSKSSMYTQQEAADNSPAVGLIAVVYTSDVQISKDDITDAIQNDQTLTVPSIEPGGTLPTDANQQLCSTVNPVTVSGTTATPNTKTTTQFTGSTSTPSAKVTMTAVNTKTQTQKSTSRHSTQKSTSRHSTQTLPTTTEAPASEFKPCPKRIVVAIDNSFTNSYVKAVRKFLINQVFAGNWNHVERLGLLWYSSKTETSYPFNYLSDSGKDLDFVRRSINSKSPLPRTSPSLVTAFEDLNTKYDIGGRYSEVKYIVFVSQINQEIVDSVNSTAQLLKAKGGLSLIGLGAIDPTDQFFKQLTETYRRWDDPNNTPVLPRWEQFFWNSAYGCNDAPPPDAPTIGTEPTITFPQATTTPEPSIMPCDGRIAVFLDRSSSLATGTYNNQQSFVGRTLFSDHIFSKYTRLSIGSYNVRNADTVDFGIIGSPADVKTYTDRATKLTTGDSNLRRALSDIGAFNYAKNAGPPVTIIVFVSNLSEDQTDDAKAAAQVIQGQGIRLYLVAHGVVDENLLAQVTGDANLVKRWKESDTTIPNYANWFKTAIACPTSSSMFLGEESEI